jgi:hypothetical protein
MSDPVQVVPINAALSVSLNNYYDLLKNQVGGLAAQEFLQLKLVADPVDLSSTGYPWFSYWNLLNRSDLAIQPTAVSSVVMVSSARLSDVYRNFLRLLRNYVVQQSLSSTDQTTLNTCDSDEDGLRSIIAGYQALDRHAWTAYAALMGFQPGDSLAYVNWLSSNGHLGQIQEAYQKIIDIEFTRRTILFKKYPVPSDQEIVDTELLLYSLTMKLDYPVYPDTTYLPTVLTLNYLSQLSLAANGEPTAQFDNRLAVSWNESLQFIQTTGAGGFTASMDRTTQNSNSISTDWGASASGGYLFISGNASASDQTQIQEDFNNVISIGVSAGSAFKLQIAYPDWFKPDLFSNQRVLENPSAFVPFLGPQGSLLYYPTHLILVRGFKATFTSSQNWTYDYHNKFSASGGGGFNAFGYSFGNSDSYTNETKQHSVDVAGTQLTIADDPSTVRFVGYCVHENNALVSKVADLRKAALKSLYALEVKSQAEKLSSEKTRP